MESNTRYTALLCTVYTAVHDKCRMSAKTAVQYMRIMYIYIKTCTSTYHAQKKPGARDIPNSYIRAGRKCLLVCSAGSRRTNEKLPPNSHTITIYTARSYTCSCSTGFECKYASTTPPSACKHISIRIQSMDQSANCFPCRQFSPSAYYM